MLAELLRIFFYTLNCSLNGTNRKKKLIQVGVRDQSLCTLYKKCFLVADQEVTDTKILKQAGHLDLEETAFTTEKVAMRSKLNLNYFLLQGNFGNNLK